MEDKLRQSTLVLTQQVHGVMMLRRGLLWNERVSSSRTRSASITQH
jgi:hypothetical protein